jgi:hypothetical protein
MLSILQPMVISGFRPHCRSLEDGSHFCYASISPNSKNPVLGTLVKAAGGRTPHKSLETHFGGRRIGASNYGKLQEGKCQKAYTFCLRSSNHLVWSGCIISGPGYSCDHRCGQGPRGTFRYRKRQVGKRKKKK